MGVPCAPADAFIVTVRMPAPAGSRVGDALLPPPRDDGYGGGMSRVVAADVTVPVDGWAWAGIGDVRRALPSDWGGDGVACGGPPLRAEACFGNRVGQAAGQRFRFTHTSLDCLTQGWSWILRVTINRGEIP